MRLREEDEDGIFDVTYSLEPTATALGLRSTTRSIGRSRGSNPQIARAMVSRDIGHQLSVLKALLERD
jgi:hypothetical protein